MPISQHDAQAGLLTSNMQTPAAAPLAGLSGGRPTEQLAQASPDLLRGMVAGFVQALMSAEADAVCGVEYGVSSSERTNTRNGYRHREALEAMRSPRRHREAVDVMGSSAFGGARWTRSVENPPVQTSYRPGVTGAAPDG